MNDCGSPIDTVGSTDETHTSIQVEFWAPLRELKRRLPRLFGPVPLHKRSFSAERIQYITSDHSMCLLRRVKLIPPNRFKHLSGGFSFIITPSLPQIGVPDRRWLGLTDQSRVAGWISASLNHPSYIVRGADEVVLRVIVHVFEKSVSVEDAFGSRLLVAIE
jgi:hypothetical protein